jgi:hypothetical protein
MINVTLSADLLDSPGQRAGFVLLAAFIVAFLFIRTSARLMRSDRVSWWPGSVETSGGLHLHHLVFGIVLLLASGFLSFVTQPGSPRTEILAGIFGVGAGLTLDEFALWVYLRDVYWAEEGRSSFDAVVLAAALAGLILLGVHPLGLQKNSVSVATVALTVLTALLLSAAAILKGKPVLGVIGILLPLVSLVGALRLASPTSPWARRRYDPGGSKRARAEARWERIEQRRRRLSNAIAGAPERRLPLGVQFEARQADREPVDGD